jgi:hypothetical protein
MTNNELIELQKQLDKLKEEYILNNKQLFVIHNMWEFIHDIRQGLVKPESNK